ncbi:TonB-dependent receptor plug [Allomuricauda ruestringensis DSM 13258]|uniref:TonB-dependent receptor plug n=2 Tax=Flagellimonas TaxID=444459 RepID=G2PKN8_ALLRU|nr:TonB-dependent receptor plug [Allomuricauda ruestringensis DSM 13258]
MLLALVPLFAYTQNTLSGKILDAETGEPLEQVSVYIPQLENGTVTDQNGNYSLKNLPEGNYKLVISYIGFETYSTSIEINSENNQFDYQMSPSAIEMDEVVLSTPFHKLQRENVMKVEQKSMEELKQQGGITLSEGITNIPGVSSVSTGVGIGKPVIRGLSFNRVLVYTQGVRLENQQYGGEHGLGINDAGISSVEVIKGPASLLYGSDALGGVLYLNPEKFEASGETSGDVNMRYFTNTLGYNANAGFKTSGEKLKFLVRGAYATNADYETGDGTSVTNSRFNEADLKTGLAYQASKFKTELRYNYNASELGIPEEIGVQNNDRDPLMPYQELSTHIISSKNNFFFKKSSLEATFGYTVNNRKEFEEHHHEEEHEGEEHEGEEHTEEEHAEEEHEEGEGAALDMRLSTLNYNIQFNPQWGKMTTIFGVQGMHQTNENFGEEVLVPNATTNDFGVLATSHIHFNNSDLQIGLRYDLRSINGEESGIEGDEEYIPALNKDFNSFNAAVGYRMDLTQNVMGRLNLATGFRAPNLSELTSNGLHSGANRVEIGNPDLDSEQNFQVDLALEYGNKHIEAYVNTFYNIINDYIYLEPTGEFRELDPIYNFQQQNATLYGGEFGFHLHPHPLDWLHLESSYDIVFGELEDKSDLPLIPANRWTNTFRVEWNKNQDYKYYAFVTLQTFFDQNKVADFETPTSRYNLFNVGVGGDIRIFNQKVGYSITGNNLFDKNYISHLSRLKADGIANIGRNISFNLNIPL